MPASIFFAKRSPDENVRAPQPLRALEVFFSSAWLETPLVDGGAVPS
jgi:hypothetical protein